MKSLLFLCFFVVVVFVVVVVVVVVATSATASFFYLIVIYDIIFNTMHILLFQSELYNCIFSIQLCCVFFKRLFKSNER